MTMFSNMFCTRDLRHGLKSPGNMEFENEMPRLEDMGSADKKETIGRGRGRIVKIECGKRARGTFGKGEDLTQADPENFS